MRKKLFSEIPYLENERIVLKRITDADAGPLQELVSNDRIYRYLPTFLFERKYPDIRLVIDRLYTECFRESIILGIFEGGKFCGLAEMYGFKDQIHKISPRPAGPCPPKAGFCPLSLSGQKGLA